MFKKIIPDQIDVACHIRSTLRYIVAQDSAQAEKDSQNNSVIVNIRNLLILLKHHCNIQNYIKTCSFELFSKKIIHISSRGNRRFSSD